jgi:outer membrane protein assembly factor BamA
MVTPMIKYFLFVSLLSLGLAYGEGQKISQISIQGNNRIENQTILSYLPIKVGDTADLYSDH